MSLRIDEYAKGRVVKILVACPACGYEFAPEERRRHHLGEHDPEDFGLNPLGEIDPNHDDPLFDDPVPAEYKRTITIEPLPHGDANGLVDLLANTGVSPGKIAVTTSASAVAETGGERAVTIGPLPHEEIPGIVERLTKTGIDDDAITVTDTAGVPADDP